MNEVQAVVLIVLLFCAAFAFAVWLIHQDNTVVVRREPSEFELAAQRFSESMKDLQRAFAVALIPAFEEATWAINRFGALLREASNQDRDPASSPNAGDLLVMPHSPGDPVPVGWTVEGDKMWRRS